MTNIPSVSFDRDIFELQMYGGIRLYFTQLNSAILSSNPSRLQPLRPSLPSDVLPIAPQLRGSAFLKGVRLCSLLASFTSSMLPSLPWQPRKIYHSTYYRNPLLCWSLNPVVVTVHDMIHECYPQYFDSEYLPFIQSYVRAKRRSILAADAIIAVSHATKEDLTRVYPQLDPSSVYVIHHGSDHVPVRSVKVHDESLLSGVTFRRFFLYVGSRSHYKGFNDFLEAFVNFSRVFHDFGIICVGQPFTGEEEARIKRLSLGEKVICTPASESELVRYYQSAYAFVYPSWREGFGLPILEAMRARCPVLCSDIPSSREIASQHALFFKYADPKDLSSKLLDFVNLNPELRHRQIESALEHASRFTWELSARRTVDLYLSLLNRHVS